MKDAWERRLENINALHEVREIGFHAEFVCWNVVSLAVALSSDAHILLLSRTVVAAIVAQMGSFTATDYTPRVATPQMSRTSC
jgi:hypothetical protein